MNQSLRDEDLVAANAAVPSRILVASTSLAALMAGEAIQADDGSWIEGHLVIPDYQRPYRWAVEQVSKLLADLRSHFDPAAPVAPRHDFYLGSIILHQVVERGKRKDQLNIIDGQQRLISMALLAFVLGQRSLTRKLTLQAPETLARAQLNLDWLKTQVLPAVDFARVNVTLVVTRDEDDAYRFFETQNTGGVRLNGVDIIKAHHLRAAAAGDQEHFARAWEQWGDLRPLVELVMMGRYWQPLQWRELSSHRQTLLRRDQIVDELAEGTRPGADLAYRQVVSQTHEGHLLHAMSPGYDLRQPLHAGANAVRYLEYFNELRERLLITRRDLHLKPFHAFYDALVLRAEGSPFLQRLFDCAVLLYVSRFGHQRLNEAALWIFRVAFAPRLINEKAVRENSVPGFVRTQPLLDWIATSFTHEQAMGALSRCAYKVDPRVDERSVKLRFVQAVQTYFELPLTDARKGLDPDFDTTLKQAIQGRLAHMGATQ